MSSPIPLTIANPGLLVEGKQLPVLDDDGHLVGCATRTGDQVFLKLNDEIAGEELAKKLRAPHAGISLGYSIGLGPTGDPLEIAIVDEMLPCPFCRGSALTVGVQPGSEFPRVTCGECGTRGPLARSDANREAIANWNRRPGLW